MVAAALICDHDCRYLDIIPNEGTWRPVWMLPVIIILPIVSLFIAALILVWLVDQESHMRLLRALIPADMMTLGGRSGSSNQLMARGMFGADLLRSSRLERSESSAVDDVDVIMDSRSRALLPGVSASRAMSGKQGSNRLQSKPSGMVAVQTPAERILNMVGQLLQNKMPHIEDILAVREVMSKGVDIHQAPIGFERALEMKLDKDVAASLLALVDDRPTAMGSGRNNVKKRNFRHTSALTPVDEDSSVRQHHHLEGTQRSLLLGGVEVHHTDLRNQDAKAPYNVRTIIAASVSDSAMLMRQHEDLVDIQNLNLNDGQQKVDVANMTASMIGLSHDGPQATLPPSYAGCGTSNTSSLSPYACQQATLAVEGVQIAQSQIEGGNYVASSHKFLLEDGHNNSDQVLSFSVPTLSVIKVPAVASAQAQALLSMLKPESLSEEPKLLSLLEAACNNWSFDTFKLQDATWGHALSMLSFYILTVDTDIADALDLNKQDLANFLAAIEALYCTSNPYHCGVHGADVLQMFALLVKRVMKPRRYVDSPVVHLACIIAAVVHDVDHKGVNNDFLINSKDPLALLYNDESPMEAYHCCVTFKILYQKDCNFISHLQEADQKLFRHLVIKLVLATDMKQHFSIVSRFCAQHRLGPTPSADKLAKGIVYKKVQVVPEQGLPPVDEAERLLSLQMALKISDLRATGLPVEVGQEWVLRLEEELFKQGDRERALGLPVSPLSDRKKPESGVSKAQPGFYEFIVLPLAYNFMHVFPEIRDGPMHGFRQAYHAWRRLAAKGGGDSSGDMTTLRSSVDGNDADLTDSPAPVLHNIHNRSDSRVPSSSSAAESKTSLPSSLRNSNGKSGDESNMQKRDLTHPSGKAEGSALDEFNDEVRHRW
ncbi:hypothetical protein CEUSTIGMA_g12448.t1 [Chlamydomonas eustigma]|uniref:Phosphodiesterase n=1 Tax=Chlamydomonas eustigma TaxID=1157962 RepID=A0A250XPP2_9CHLO|nr:hypothetical protein CEUSTIGMA_g12448.t1 [Chlamydomonas eustigma]|eukprot:GAX85028.1 hypothetical protein CEUSTIGMA_g12448.t1 [Chlamydomonas eustigma]